MTLKRSQTQICEPGIAPPKYDPQSVLGTEFHKKMLAITSTNYKAGLMSVLKYLLTRCKLHNKYHLLKYRYFISQPFFFLRLLNFMLFLIERKRVNKVHHLPPYISMEVCSICNLRCPACVTGLRDADRRKSGKATMATVKRVIDQITRRCFQINFFNNGEPLLNDEFYNASAYAVRKGLWTIIHSHLNVKDDDLPRKLIESGLHNLTVSCDGATQEVYGQYRRGGNLDLVLENMQKIAAEKRKRGVNFPWIVAKFLVFDHNWHEIGMFKEKALETGADEVVQELSGVHLP